MNYHSQDVSALVEGLVTEKVKDVKNTSRSQVTPSPGSAKNKTKRGCVKREKMVKDKKKKSGKKKDETDGKTEEGCVTHQSSVDKENGSVVSLYQGR